MQAKIVANELQRMDSKVLRPPSSTKTGFSKGDSVDSISWVSQGKHEPVIEYIRKGRSVNLNANAMLF